MVGEGESEICVCSSLSLCVKRRKCAVCLSIVVCVERESEMCMFIFLGEGESNTCGKRTRFSSGETTSPQIKSRTCKKP